MESTTKDKTPVAHPQQTPECSEEPPYAPMSILEVIYWLASRSDPLFLQCYDDYPESKRWALADGLAIFAKLHGVSVSFILNEVPQGLFEAYMDTLMGNEELGDAVASYKHAEVSGSDADAYTAMAIIEGWDEEASKSEIDAEIVGHEDQP